MKAILLCAVLLMSGCAMFETTWRKAGSTEEDFFRDDGECKAQAYAATSHGLRQQLIFQSCMKGKGWRMS